MLPAPFVEGIFRRSRPHGGVPHGQGELLVAQGSGAIERVRGTGGDADDTGLLGLPAGRPAEIEITGCDHQLGTLVDQLHRDIAHRDRVALAVQVDKLDRLAQQILFARRDALEENRP
jgi:hypothetical protein